MQVKKLRVDLLEKITYESRKAYLNNLLGKSFVVLTEDEENGFTVGYTENYIKVYLPQNTNKNVLLNVKLKSEYLDGCKGEIV